MNKTIGGLRVEVSADTTKLTRGMDKAVDSVDKLSAKTNSLNSNTKKISSSFAGLGRGAGQASIQVQQLVGQVSGGVNPMIALSQQAADLGIVLGLPLLGSVVGIAAAMGSSLIPALGSSGKATAELTDKLKDLREEYVLTAEQQALISASENKENQEKQKRINIIQKEINSIEELQRKRMSAGTGTDTGQFAVPRSAQQNQLRFAKAIEQSNQKLIELRAEQVTLSQEIGKIERVKAENTQKTSDVTETLTQQLAVMTAEIQHGSVYAQQLSAAFELGLSSVDELPESIRKSITAINEMKEAQKAAMEEGRGFEAFNKAIDQQIEIERRAEEVKAANQAIANQTFIDGLLERNRSELDAIESKRMAELEMLATFNEQELAQLGGFEAAKTAIEENAARAREKIAEMESAAKIKATSGAFNSLSSLMNTGSKKLFAIGKAAAKAGAIVDGYAAVQGAIKEGNKVGGPVLGAAFGAAAAIQTAVQIRNINAQQFGSAGSAVSFSGGLPAVNTQQVGQQQAQPQRNVSINLQGSNFSAEQVRALIGQINEQVGDGVFIA